MASVYLSGENPVSCVFGSEQDRVAGTDSRKLVKGEGRFHRVTDDPQIHGALASLWGSTADDGEGF